MKQPQVLPFLTPPLLARSTTPLSVANVLIPPILFRLNAGNLALQGHDIFGSFFNGRLETMGLLQPTRAIRHGFLASTKLLLNLLAESTLVRQINGAKDHFHAASFTDAILSVAVLFEVAPLPVTAGELVALEEAHDVVVDAGVWAEDLSVLLVSACHDAHNARALKLRHYLESLSVRMQLRVWMGSDGAIPLTRQMIQAWTMLTAPLPHRVLIAID